MKKQNNLCASARTMSNTSESLSVVSIYADSGDITSLKTGSINNTDAITTDTLTTREGVQVGGGLNVNGNATVYGHLKVDGGISFGDIAFLKDNDEFVVKSNLTVKGSAIFSYDSIIGKDTFNGKVEGVISAQNIRASNRFFVGDSPFEINAFQRTVLGDTFTASFKEVIADKVRSAKGIFETLTAGNAATTGLLEMNKATAQQIIVNDLQAQNFTASTDFLTKNLTIDGSAVVSGGITINGSGRNEGALLVNKYPAIFNKGIIVYGKEGTVTQTLSVIGTTDTTGTSAKETEEKKFALETAVGVRSLFQGDVVVEDSYVILDNSQLKAEKILLGPVSGVSEDTSFLDFYKSGDGFDAVANNQIIYESDERPAEEGEQEEVLPAGARSAKDIAERAEKPYVGRAVDITSDTVSKFLPRAAVDIARKAARAMSVATITRSFKIKDGALYRIDAGGNILAKNAIIQDIKADTLKVHDLTAGTFRTGNFVTDNIAVEGVVTSKQGISIGQEDPNTGATTGTSEVFGKVHNYATVVNHDTASIEFSDQSIQTFKSGSTLKVANGANMVTDDDADVSLHGHIELDLKNLVLFNSENGKRYRFILRDAIGEEGDADGDVSMEFGEIEPEQPDEPAATTTTDEGEAAGARRRLRADLEEFQAKLKRI